MNKNRTEAKARLVRAELTRGRHLVSEDRQTKKRESAALGLTGKQYRALQKRLRRQAKERKGT